MRIRFSFSRAVVNSIALYVEIFFMEFSQYLTLFEKKIHIDFHVKISDRNY